VHSARDSIEYRIVDMLSCRRRHFGPICGDVRVAAPLFASSATGHL
jgi:hypothetical protein